MFRLTTPELRLAHHPFLSCIFWLAAAFEAFALKPGLGVLVRLEKVLRTEYICCSIIPQCRVYPAFFALLLASTPPSIRWGLFCVILNISSVLWEQLSFFSALGWGGWLQRREVFSQLHCISVSSLFWYLP